MAALAVTSCAVARAPATQSIAGWYSEHASARSFQPCNGAARPITDAGDLPTRARAFGLQPDTPVYVRLLVEDARPSTATAAIKVRQVLQFGSPTPVRDCPMNGMVLPSPASAASR